MTNEKEPGAGNGIGGRKVSGRLPKYRRAGEAFGKMEITERDERILELIYKYRYIQAPQIFALLGGNARQIARRLQGLYHHELVTRIVPQVRMVVLDRKVHDDVRDDEEGRRVPFSGSPKMTYVLDQAGAKHLAERVYECPMSELGFRVQHQRRTEWFVEHHVAISEFHAVLELACRQRSDLELLDWAQDAEAHGQCTWKRVPPRNEEETFRVAPDAYFAVEKNSERSNFFLEIDRGSEESSRIHSKLEAYGWFLASPSFLKKYARAEDVRILIVTTTETRMRNMMGTVEKLLNGQDYKGRPYRKVPGLTPGRVWFTTAEYNVSEPERLLTPVWRTVKAPNKTVALFK